MAQDGLGLEIAHDLRKNRVRPVLVEDGRELVHHENVVLELCDQILRRAGHELHEKAAGRLDAVVGIDEHAEAAGCGDLLALDEIGRQVLRDLAADELRAANIRLTQADVAADGEHAVLADGAADVELAVRARGQGERGVRDHAAHIALAVRHGDDAAEASAAADTQCERAVFLLEQVAEHRRRAQATAEGGDRRRAAVVDGVGALHRVARGDDRNFHKTVF